MTRSNPEEQRLRIRQWKAAGARLEQLRREKLRGMPYNWEEAMALLELGRDIPPRPDNGQGLVAMQRIFRKADPRRKDASADTDTDTDTDTDADTDRP